MWYDELGRGRVCPAIPWQQTIEPVALAPDRARVLGQVHGPASHRVTTDAGGAVVSEQHISELYQILLILPDVEQEALAGWTAGTLSQWPPVDVAVIRVELHTVDPPPPWTTTAGASGARCVIDGVERPWRDAPPPGGQPHRRWGWSLTVDGVPLTIGATLTASRVTIAGTSPTPPPAWRTVTTGAYVEGQSLLLGPAGQP